jgi:hypothetical protein
MGLAGKENLPELGTAREHDNREEMCLADCSTTPFNSILFTYLLTHA